MVRRAGVVLVLLSPTLLFTGAVQVLRAGRLIRDRRRNALRPMGPPLERIAADSRRLRQQLLDAENGPGATPGPGPRVHALRTAYADCLREAARALDVPVAGDLVGRELHRVEAALLERGLDVAQTADH